jgi:hypothetical protein
LNILWDRKIQGYITGWRRHNMKYKNSFFHITSKEDGTFLDVFPPQGDGKNLEEREIAEFLRNKGIEFENQAIRKALDMLKGKPVRIRLNDEATEPFPESAVLKISDDRTLAYMRFYPPVAGGRLMDKKEILGELELYKVKFGISEKVIDLFLANRQYCVNIPVARAQQAVPAKDTLIEYLFDTRPLAKPKMLEDGSVDFHKLDLFTRVSKGQVLARMTKHKDGINGTDVCGNVIYATKPKVKVFKYGRNIEVSEDETELISMIDGDVTLTNGTVFVSDTYNIAADVDPSTGDIDYDGSVFIPGTVRTGFTVKAKGDIQVNGVVEGATLIAGGNIVIKRGVQGMGKGKLVAGGDLCAQFLESANVEVQGDVNAGSILHSDVKAGANVIVSGKKGFIVGGEIVCGSYVEVNSIGNKMETQTAIKVGVKPELIDELKVSVQKGTELNKQIEETSSYLNVFRNKIKKGAKLTPENIKQVKQHTTELEELEKEREENNQHMIDLKSQVDMGKNGRIKVTGETYAGVTIFIASEVHNVKEPIAHCLYKIVEGSITPTVF